MLLKKIVIAEDDEACAQLVAATLGDAGYLCFFARDGEAALTRVRSELPDILVLDVMLPRMDGFEVVRRLKADLVTSRVPVLMLTALADVPHRVEGLEAGADDYLPKPFDLRELVARVRALIRQSRRERDRNPTTNLPGASAIDDHVASLQRLGQPFALLLVDLGGYDAYLAACGFVAGDDLVAALGGWLLDRIRLHSLRLGGSSIFLGHVGGDDFVLTAEPGEALALCEDLSTDFVASQPLIGLPVARAVAAVGGEAERRAERQAAGGGGTAGEQGPPQRFGLKIAVVDNTLARCDSLDELAGLAAQTRRALGEREDTAYLFWKP